MKFLVSTFILFIILSSSIHAQQIKMEGFGPFKMGKSVDEVINTVTKDKGKLKTFKGSIHMSSKSLKGVFEIKADLENTSNNEMAAPYCSDARLFYIDEFTISGFTIQKIYLHFYKNELVEFHSEYSTDLNDAMTAKYGEPAKKTDPVISHCGGVSGTALDMTTQGYTNTWGQTDSTGSYAYSYLEDNYDSDCHKQYLSFFIMTNSVKERAFFDCNYAAEKALTAQKAADKKKKSSDF